MVSLTLKKVISMNKKLKDLVIISKVANTILLTKNLAFKILLVPKMSNLFKNIQG
jgi:hypothetical protein